MAQVESVLDMLESYSYNQVAQKTDISKSTLIKAMKNRKTEDFI